MLLAVDGWVSAYLLRASKVLLYHAEMVLLRKPKPLIDAGNELVARSMHLDLVGRHGALRQHDMVIRPQGRSFLLSIRIPPSFLPIVNPSFLQTDTMMLQPAYDAGARIHR